MLHSANYSPLGSVTDGTTFINLLSNTALPPHKKVVPTETNTLEQLNTVSREGMPETCQLIQPALKNKDIVPAPSAGETNTCLELQWDFTPQPPASPRERLSEEHRRSLSVKRCPPALDMDPLCIFMMLRAQQTSPVSEADQSSYCNLINLLLLLFLKYNKFNLNVFNYYKTFLVYYYYYYKHFKQM